MDKPSAIIYLKHNRRVVSLSGSKFGLRLEADLGEIQYI